jgi:branched-chain amino acid transport system substrate-binding protein
MRLPTAKILLALTTMAAGLVVSAGPAFTTPASAAGSPVTVAFIASLTGLASSQYGNAQQGFLARVALQNARGGVNGHRINTIVIDDGTNPSNVATGVQEAVSKGVIGIVADSALFFSGAKYAQQAGVPVTGAYNDGPEWGEQPYTNMFASDRGSVDPKYPVNTLIGKLVKKFGGTVIGSYGYGISPSSASAAVDAAQSFKVAGGRIGVLDTSLPFGTLNFTTVGLVAKQKGVDALVPSMDDNSNFALTTAAQQAGARLKAVIFPTGYEPRIIHDPVWRTLQGDYFEAAFRPFSLPNAGTLQMAAALQRYAGFTPGQFPTYAQYQGWLGADLMIRGLQGAGANPTHQSVIKALRAIKGYNGNGLLPITIDYSTVFGKDLPTCIWVLRATPQGFAPVSPNAFCGSDVPGTTTVQGS